MCTLKSKILLKRELDIDTKYLYLNKEAFFNMKPEKILFLSFLLIFQMIYAQEIPWDNKINLNGNVKKIHIVDPLNSRDETIFFDKNGFVERNRSITEVILNKKVTYERQLVYDKGKLVKEFCYYDNVLKYDIEYQYDGENLVLEKEIDIEKDSITKQFTYCYLGNKLVSKQIHHKNDNFDIEEMIYDSDNNLIETRTSYDDSLRAISREFKNNNCKIIENYIVERKIPILTERRKYCYDVDKNIVEELYYDGFLKDEVYRSRIVNEYKNNVCIESKYYENNKLVYNLFFDSRGNIITEDKSMYGGNITTFKNVYNKHGDLVKVKRIEKNKLATITKYDIEYW